MKIYWLEIKRCGVWMRYDDIAYTKIVHAINAKEKLIHSYVRKWWRLRIVKGKVSQKEVVK